MASEFDYANIQSISPGHDEIEKRMRMTPREYREMCRKGKWQPDTTLTQYYCQGYSQHAVVIIPVEYALEFLIFCLRNPRSCYVADVCDPGSPTPQFIARDADIRTDCHRYRVFRDGVVVDEPYEITAYWRDDLVTFLLNCSMGFEGVLREKHVNFRNNGTHVSNIRCVPSGRFTCDNMIVSTRIFPTSLDAIRAIQLTSQFPVSHGYPIHVGNPTEIGIDLRNPLWSPYYPHDPPLPGPGEIVMTWACANTPAVAIEEAKPPLSIMHYPGMVFISDRRTEEFHSSFTS